MKVKDFLEVYDDLVLFSIDGKIIGDNVIGSKKDKFKDCEIASVKSFYFRTGMYNYGVIINLKSIER